MNSNKRLACNTAHLLHGARSLPPAQAIAALRPFMESMRDETSKGDKLADASAAAVDHLVRSLEANQVATDDLWQGAIETTLSFANEAGYLGGTSTLMAKQEVGSASQIIEVTQVTIVEGGSVSPKKRMIETENIVSIATSSENLSVILLAGGELVNVRETYEQLKKLTGVVNDA
jgi:hypothetical protein